MRLRVFFPLFLCALIAATVTPARSQNGQGSQRVLDDFMRTRGSDFEPREKPPGKPIRPSKRPDVGVNQPPRKKSGSVNPQSDSDVNGDPVIVPASLSRIGLGYTIFRYKPGTDEFVAVEPGTVFKEGDQLRLALEANADGYLYIFNAENDSQPNMLYPNAKLDGGRNNISAHTRDLYPADPEQLFTIEGKPATERFYIIFSRKPLSNVPTGKDLDKFCDRNSTDCDWLPTPAQWESIKALASGTQVVEGRNGELARAEIRVPGNSLTRSVKLRPKAPLPAVVRMSASTTADVLLTTIDIVHN